MLYLEPNSGFHAEDRKIEAHDQCTNDKISEEDNKIDSSLQSSFDHFLDTDVIVPEKEFPEQIEMDAIENDAFDQLNTITDNCELEALIRLPFQHGASNIIDCVYNADRWAQWILNCDPESGLNAEDCKVEARNQCTKEDIIEEKNEVDLSLQLNFDHLLCIDVIETCKPWVQNQ